MKAKTLSLWLSSMLVATAAYAEAPIGNDDYVRYCSACHGEEADGQGPVANVLTPRPPALTSLRSKYGKPLGTELVVYVMGSAMPRAHGTSDMPVWGKILRDENGRDSRATQTIWKILLYLESIQTEP